MPDMPRPARRRIAILCAALAAAACTATERPSVPGARTTVDTIAGVPHVANAGTPATWRLEPLLDVAEAGGEPFGRLTGVTGTAAGDVYAADALARRIYHFAPDGRFVAALGREGGGPGEFRSMRSLAWVGPHLATLDAGNGRVTLVGTDGAPGPDVRWLALTGTGFGLEQTAPGEAYAPLPVFSPERRSTSTQVYLRLTAAGVADTLAGRRIAAEGRATGVVCEGERGIHFFSVPDSPRPYAGRAPGRRTVLGETGHYRLAVVGPAGDTVRVVTRDGANPPFTDAEWAATREDWAEFQERVRGTRCDPADITRPASKPAFAEIFFDDRARMWVEAYDRAGFRFDVFDSTGALVGELPAPARDRSVTPAVLGGRLHYVALDSLDVQTLRVARVVEPRGDATPVPR